MPETRYDRADLLGLRKYHRACPECGSENTSTLIEYRAPIYVQGLKYYCRVCQIRWDETHPAYSD